MNVLEILGRLSRARENVKLAQREIGKAEQGYLEREETLAGKLPGPAPVPRLAVMEALVRAKQAVADLETLVENTKSG